ncbi:hypothetical protein [Asaia sp. HN010]|uniref:hypothetical protein n=1 Tax=Asaia sp. HN010 TaxID=3081233 RepID=UPI0030164E2B
MSGPYGRHPVAPCASVWFEPLSAPLHYESALRVVFAKPVREEKIQLLFAVGDQTLVLHFEQLAIIKGQQVFEATDLQLEGCSDLPPGQLLFQPVGPLDGVLV